MKAAAEALRAETKERAGSQWKGKLAKIGMWFQAADWLEDQQYDDAPAWDLSVLAEALRAHNIRFHDLPAWPDIEDNARDLWMHHAEQVHDEIEKAVKRRGA